MCTCSQCNLVLLQQLAKLVTTKKETFVMFNADGWRRRLPANDLKQFAQERYTGNPGNHGTMNGFAVVVRQQESCGHRIYGHRM
jgi:hypothetical protein